MMKTKFNRNFRRQLSAILSGGLVVALAFFLSTSFTSLHAQTPGWLGQDATKQIIQKFNGEINYLQDEINNPPPGAKTAKNEALIKTYNEVIKSFTIGSDLKDILSLGVIQVFTSNSLKTANANADAPQDLQNVVTFIKNWNVQPRNLEDVDEALQLIREHKNQ